jgi:hypothetical protein
MRKHLFELIAAIIKRPAMFSVNRVEDIQLIIFGYSTCAIQDSDNLENFGELFRTFVNEHFESRADHDWARLIRFHSASDIHSIELFADLLNKFKQESN